MRVGDLVVYDHRRWWVSSLVAQTRLAVLYSSLGERRSVPDTLDVDDPEACQVMAHPPTEWRTVVAPLRPKAGPIVRLVLQPSRARPTTLDLERLIDWAASDPVRPGGPLLFPPEGPVRRGDSLVATYRDGTMARVVVPRSYGTIDERKARQGRPGPEAPPAERTRVERNVLDE
jgi:hypothetical protein